MVKVILNNGGSCTELQSTKYTCYGFQVMHEYHSKHAPFSSVQEQIASDPGDTECPFLPFADQW